MMGEEGMTPLEEIRVDKLEQRIEALEDTHPEDLKDVAQDINNLFAKLDMQYERIVALEARIKAIENYLGFNFQFRG